MALTEKIIALISKTSLFRGFNDLELETFLRFTGGEDYSPNQVIIKEGERGNNLYIIESGLVAVVTAIHVREELKKMREKKYKVLAQLKDGDFFGEIGFFTSNPIVKPLPCTISLGGEFF